MTGWLSCEPLANRLSPRHNAQMSIATVSVGNAVTFGNHLPFVLVGGINVIEDEDSTVRATDHFVTVTARLGIPFVFKASFDKANRSSIDAFRGPGIDEGLRILEQVKRRFGRPILTDVHEPDQAAPVAEVADILQLPAFLARQTDLVLAIGRTGKPVNVKKPQFLAPEEMRHVIAKLAEAGNERVILCERGSSFGYNNLVVDMLGMDLMKSMAPVMFDATHSLQIPGGRAGGAGGRRQQAASLARSAMAVGIAALFLEAHRDPSQAKCDGPSALPLEALEPYLEQMLELDRVVKSFPPVSID